MPAPAVIIYMPPGRLFCEQAKAWVSEAGIPYREIDTSADEAKVAEMIQDAQGTWIFPTMAIGEEVGLGFDSEWIQAQLAKHP